MLRRIIQFIILLPPILFADLEKDRALFTNHTNILAQISSVEGCSVGFGGSTGAFYMISTGLRKYGAEEDFVHMTESINPIVKCMGIYCLSNTGAAQALRVIKENLSDSQLITYQPFGCEEFPVSVGYFCWEVLVDRDHLEDIQKNNPMVALQELSGVALEVLLHDETWHIHWKTSKYLNELIKDGRFKLSLSSMRKAAPQLEDYQLIKAVGRIERSESIKPFLIELLKNEALDEMSKMATASALTRFADKEIFELITGQTELLNSIPTNSASVIRNGIHEAMTHRENMKPIKKARTTSQMKRVGGEYLLTTYSTSHPIAFDDYEYRIHTATVMRYEELRKRIVQSIITMCRNKSSYTQSWNSYSDIPNRIQGMINRNYKDLLKDEEIIQMYDALK